MNEEIKLTIEQRIQHLERRQDILDEKYKLQRRLHKELRTLVNEFLLSTLKR